MSSYLSIYIKPKEIDKKVLLFSYSRSSDIYQFFWENNLSTYAYSNDSNEERFKELNKAEFALGLAQLNEEINNLYKKLNLMEKHKELTTIEDISSLQEYIEEQKDLKSALEMIQCILPSEYSCNDVEAVYTNYD